MNLVRDYELDGSLDDGYYDGLLLVGRSLGSEVGNFVAGLG